MAASQSDANRLGSARCGVICIAGHTGTWRPKEEWAAMKLGPGEEIRYGPGPDRLCAIGLLVLTAVLLVVRVPLGTRGLASMDGLGPEGPCCSLGELADPGASPVE